MLLFSVSSLHICLLYYVCLLVYICSLTPWASDQPASQPAKSAPLTDREQGGQPLFHSVRQ